VLPEYRHVLYGRTPRECQIGSSLILEVRKHHAQKLLLP